MKKQKLTKKFIESITPPLNRIVEFFGEYYAGLLLCILTDSLEKYSDGEQRLLRTIELKYNDYFSFVYDFDQDDIKDIKVGLDKLEKEVLILSILKEKRTNIGVEIDQFDDYDEYKSVYDHIESSTKLTKEEFELFKKYF